MALKLLQQFHLDLDKFLNWLAEAETTCNVLIDATNEEKLAEHPEAARRWGSNLRGMCSMGETWRTCVSPLSAAARSERNQFGAGWECRAYNN